MWSALLRVVVALILILPLTVWVTRTYSRKAAGGPGHVLRVIDSVSLGPNKNISLVEVGDRLLVVGSTPQQVRLLSELTEKDVVNRLKMQAEGTSASAFSKILTKRVMQWSNGKAENGTQIGEEKR